jgi:hypothetical protein
MKKRKDVWFPLSSPEDGLAILILCVSFPFLALDLGRTGGWRGCALSAAWCINHDQDPVVLHEISKNSLPLGTLSSRLVAISGTFAALFCRFMALWKSRRRLLLLKSKQQQQMDRRRFFALVWLMVSNLAMVSCALIPMSCGCLIDGKEWVYVSWRDYVHDFSLWTIYLSSIVSGFLAGYNKTSRRVLLQLTCVFAVMQSVGIWRCPTSLDHERIVLIVLEVLAIATTQFLHYGTIDRLILITPTPTASDYMLKSGGFKHEV